MQKGPEVFTSTKWVQIHHKATISKLRGPFYKETDPQENKAFYFNCFY